MREGFILNPLQAKQHWNAPILFKTYKHLNTKPIAGEAALKPDQYFDIGPSTYILNPLQAKQHWNCSDKSNALVSVYTKPIAGEAALKLTCSPRLLRRKKY